MPRPHATLLRFARRIAAAQKGLAAVEFALIAPVMLALYFGVTELSDGYVANAKLSSVASTAADLTAQENQICDAEMTDIKAALAPIMYPYPTDKLQIIITSLADNGKNQVQVAWSDASNATAHSVGQIIAIPPGLVTNGGGGSVVMAEAAYDYYSPGGHLLIGAVHMTSQFYLHPRTVSQITRTKSC